MKLQIAMDLDSMDQMLAMAAEVEGLVDIYELGTPMMLKYGVEAVKALRQRFPSATILADMKIADGGYMEAKFAVDAGADIVTVLAVAADDTIKGVMRAAHEGGKLCYADLLSVEDLAKRTQELERLGVDIIGVHTAYDVQHTGRTPFDDLKVLKANAVNAKVAVAGGVNLKTISLAKALGADIAIVGGALTTAQDRRSVAQEMRKYCD